MWSPWGMDLIEFLEARVDEGQRRAEAMEHFSNPADEYYSCAGARAEPLGDLEWGEEHCDCHLAQRKARALREVEADRALLDLYGRAARYRDLVFAQQPPRGVSDEMRAVTQMMALEQVMRLRAAVHSDHPDYRPEWQELQNSEA